jgi:hypothetical protein
MSNRTRSTASRARNTPALRTAARLGIAVNGFLNIAIGATALGIVGSGVSGSASPNGALSGLAQGPGGQLLIWVIAVGMLALGLWQFASAALESESDRRKRWMSRVKLIGKGVAYLAIAGIAVRVAVQGASGGGGAEEDLTARLLATPGGVVLVVLIGLLTFAIGGYLVVKGARKKFLDDLSVPAGAIGKATTVLGVTGYVARGLAFGVIGILFLVAAGTADPSTAGGLDAALAALAALPFGQVLLVAVAIGFIAFGVYSVVRARFAKL